MKGLPDLRFFSNAGGRQQLTCSTSLISLWTYGEKALLRTVISSPCNLKLLKEGMGKLASKWLVQNWLDLKTAKRFGDAWTGELKFFSVEKWNHFKTIFVSYPALTSSLSKTHSLNKTFRNNNKKNISCLYPFKNGQIYNCHKFKLEFKRSSTGLVFQENCKITIVRLSASFLL